MSNLQKHVNLVRILTVDGDVFYIPEENREEFESFLETRRFVTIQGETIRTTDIRRISPHKNFGYEDLPKEQRSKVERMIKEYKVVTGGEYPKPGNIKVMIKRVLNGEA